MAGWTVEFRPVVAEEDLPDMPGNLRSRVLRAIESRLGTEPARYGQRLRRSLSGLWKLRVGDYRVVYALSGRVVTIWAIRHRRDVYEDVEGRRRKASELHDSAVRPYRMKRRKARRRRSLAP